MAHVHLPDGFAITLGVKTAGTGTNLPGLLLPGQPVARTAGEDPPGCRTRTTAAIRSSRLSCRPAGIRAQRTPYAWRARSRMARSTSWSQSSSVPRCAPSHLIVETGYYWNRPGTVQRRGGAIEAKPGTAGGRAFTVRTTGPEVSDPFLTVNAPVLCRSTRRPRGGVHRSGEDAGPGGRPHQPRIVRLIKASWTRAAMSVRFSRRCRPFSDGT